LSAKQYDSCHSAAKAGEVKFLLSSSFSSKLTGTTRMDVSSVVWCELLWCNCGSWNFSKAPARMQRSIGGGNQGKQRLIVGTKDALESAEMII
jgi:hypothetical protein